MSPATRPSMGNNTNVPMILKPRELIYPADPPNPYVRRSARTKMLPAREWLGEHPIYKSGPDGFRTLIGVTKVVVTIGKVRMF